MSLFRFSILALVGAALTLCVACKPRQYNNAPQGGEFEEFKCIGSCGISTTDIKLQAAIAAAKLQPGQVKIVAHINNAENPEQGDHVKRFLDISFTNLSKAQCNSLKERYGSWAKAKSRVQCEEGKSYNLLDFVPPAIQALERQRFATQGQLSVNFFDVTNYPAAAYMPDRLQTQTNCWTTAYTVMRQAQTADDKIQAFFVSGAIDKVLQSDAYSDRLKEFPVESAPAFAERNSGLRPGDMVMVYGSAAVTAGDFQIMHAAIYVDEDLFFEKIAWASTVPARFVSFSDIVKSYSGRHAEFRFRRFKKTIPDASDVFSVAGMWGQGGSYPQALREMIIENGAPDEGYGSFAYTITNVPLVYDARGRAALHPSAGDKKTFEKSFKGSPNPFDDIADMYEPAEVREAAARGMVATPADRKFNPNNNVTREQMVSLLVSMLKQTKGMTVSVSSSVTTPPFPDVPANRWSAASIAFAKENGIVGGKPDGTFAPDGNVTRAESVVMLANAVKFAKRKLGLASTITPRVPDDIVATGAQDYKSHWAKDTIAEMGRYCSSAGVAPRSRMPMFKPDDPCLRQSAVSAIVRAYHCLHMDIVEKK